MTETTNVVELALRAIRDGIGLSAAASPTTSAPDHVVWLPPAADRLAVTAEASSVLIELTSENRAALRSPDGSSPIDWLDQPEQQRQRYGRVIVRRATAEEAKQ